MKFVVDAFTKAVSRRTNAQTRLQNGLMVRQQLQNLIAQGIVPQHERFEWVRKQARQILELLMMMAADYDKANTTGNDKASMADLLDIAEMARNHVIGIIKNGLLDPAEVELLPFDQVKGDVEVQEKEPG